MFKNVYNLFEKFSFYIISWFFVHFFGQKVKQILEIPNSDRKRIHPIVVFCKKKVLPKEHFQKPITLSKLTFVTRPPMLQPGMGLPQNLLGVCCVGVESTG